MTKREALHVLRAKTNDKSSDNNEGFSAEQHLIQAIFSLHRLLCKIEGSALSELCEEKLIILHKEIMTLLAKKKKNESEA